MAESGVTQKVAAILAADAVGYSRLMADDEPATIDALDAARAVFTEYIESNQGRVVDTAGDSVLAVFETTEGAALAASAIQARLGEINAGVPEARTMLFRIGLHLGDIREKADGTVYGDGVNVAARLEGLAEPGRIVVSGSVHDSIRGRHGLNYHFLGEQEVKNIAEPVRAYLVLAEGERAPTAPKRGRLILAGAAVALLALIVAFLWPAEHEGSLPDVATVEPEDPILAMPTGPAVAVLPFDNMSGDPQQDFFGDGLAEDIIAGLSQFPTLRVLARNSTFQFKGRAVDVRVIADEIGAQYVVEGSVRKAGDQVRVTAQLLNADDGSHLWSENYEATLTPQNLFDVQDAITTQIVSRLGDAHGAINRNAIEGVRRRPPSDLRSYDCILLAYEYRRFMTPEKHANVKTCLQQAVRENPDYSDAWSNLAYTYVDQYWSGYDGPPNPLDLANEAARKAVDLNPTSQLGYFQLANVSFFKNDLEQFTLDAERALELNPNDTEVIAALAIRFIYAGDRERGLALMEKAIQLNP
ncbi:MAG: adenylate/guanylate cyclase domain-containing protein, partial [Alphaproteobacteria bacterium]|nr:adenylate/guanylate cyclase domain-containing protein [Alphaproteobacteria bacterium]